MVTGATSPLGRALVDELASSKDCSHVLAVGRETEAPSPWPAGVRYCGVDLTHRREVDDLMCGEAVADSITTVIHLAQHRGVDDRGPAVHAQNVSAMRELLLRCLDHSTIYRFVYRSFADVYQLERSPGSLLDEDAALDFDPHASQWLRDRLEADVTACSYFGRRLQIAVLRCAEVLAPGNDSPLWSYLSARVCLRPLGFDPMLNLLSVEDAVAALTAAARASDTGIFNIPGAVTLPLSRAIAAAGHLNLPTPDPLLAPLYGLRRRLTHLDFRYDDRSRRRLRLGGIMDGTRASHQLGYEPRHPVQWPRAWWRLLVERLSELRPHHRT